MNKVCQLCGFCVNFMFQLVYFSFSVSTGLSSTDVLRPEEQFFGLYNLKVAHGPRFFSAFRWTQGCLGL